MPARKITMRKVKEILRLSLDSRLAYDQIAQALGLSKGVISKYVRLATAAGLDWPAIEAMDEDELQRQLRGDPRHAGDSQPGPAGVQPCQRWEAGRFHHNRGAHARGAPGACAVEP
jgi:hypothetical protein